MKRTREESDEELRRRVGREDHERNINKIVELRRTCYSDDQVAEYFRKWKNGK